MKPKVIVILAEDAPILEEYALIEEVADPIYVSTAEQYAAALGEARVIFSCDLSTGLVRECGTGAVTWIQTNSIGVNAVVTPEVAESSVLVTNARGLFEEPMAEFVLAGVLFQAKGLRRTVEDQRSERWEQRPTERLRGRRAIVIGAGGVGSRAALLLRAVGVEVDVVGRMRREESGSLGLVHGVAELPELLPSADDLVLAAPLTDDTRGIIGSDELARLKPGAHVLNVGRGPLIDEGALLAALRDGTVGAATLDVFDHEPLEPAHPFWSMENVLVSPHQSANYRGWQRRAVELFTGNLIRWQRGEELENAVNTSAFTSGRG